MDESKLIATDKAIEVATCDAAMRRATDVATHYAVGNAAYGAAYAATYNAIANVSIARRVSVAAYVATGGAAAQLRREYGLN